ncbi:stress responsive a b barrel domain-containing protein [Seiridium cupressi]
MAGRIHRVTMFKLPEPEHQKQLIEAYKTLSKNQQKVSAQEALQGPMPATQLLLLPVAPVQLASDPAQDGKPYILSLDVGSAKDDPRSQGFTVVSKTNFASLDDMKYYDEKCEAHAALKAFAKQNLTIQGGPSGVLTVYFEAGASSSL